jgi:hypothetical protein
VNDTDTIDTSVHTSVTSDCNDDESHPRSGSFGGDSLDSSWSLDSTNEKAIRNLSSYQRAGVNVSAYSKNIPLGLKEARLGTGRSAVTRGGYMIYWFISFVIIYWFFTSYLLLYLFLYYST